MILMLVFACRTNKDTFFYRAYHGTTARFNIVFNGNESYKEGMEAINANKKDNYTTILPIYPKVEKNEALQQAAKWDRTIEKCSKAIKKHSMLIKGIERCKPIDDTYLLLGKAYYQRQDYSDALSVFNYIIHTHTNGNVWPDAHVWIAETELQLDRIENAEENLEIVRQHIANTKKDAYKQHWEATFAQLLIKQKEYEQASIYLTELLQHKWMKKDFKTRIHFILAQVQQISDNKTDAAVNYTKVLKRNPEYEMVFNATINLALCAKDIQPAREKLQKLFKDERNESYKDQIFYTLAQLDMAEEDTTAALNNLEASVFWSFNNKHQKALSSLELAELYFARGEYVNSQLYYDTLLANMPNNFPNFTAIQRRSEILKELVANLMVIQHQDSVQYLASLSETERDTYIDALIAAYKVKEDERLADEAEKIALMENVSKRRSNTNNRTGRTTWIFADQSQNRMAIQTFRKQWGNRTLSDYWFVNEIKMAFDMGNLQMANNTSNTNEDNDSTTNTKQTNNTPSSQLTPLNKNYYLQDMPQTPEDFVLSNESIANALYNSGFIYYDNLNDKPKSNAQLEELLKRFPDHKLAAPTCFQLYSSYKSMNNEEKSAYYKNMCLTQFENTIYARIIADSNYYETIRQQENEAENYYVLVYDTFMNQHYQDALDLCNEGLNKYSNPELQSKMDYIKAICLGKLYNNDSLRNHLEFVIQRYPTSPIDTAATALLEALKQLNQTPQTPTTPQNPTNPTPKIQFTYNDKAFHFIMFIVDIKDIKINDLKNNIVDFNKEYFRREKFELANFYIDNTLQLVSVSKFANKEKAMEYYRLLLSDKKYMNPVNQNKQIKVYVISDANYTLYFQNKSIRADYDEFFSDNYLK